MLFNDAFAKNCSKCHAVDTFFSTSDCFDSSFPFHMACLFLSLMVEFKKTIQGLKTFHEQPKLLDLKHHKGQIIIIQWLEFKAFNLCVY